MTNIEKKDITSNLWSHVSVNCYILVRKDDFEGKN